MLKIGYGRPENCIVNSDLEFDEWFEPEWLTDEMNIRILREIDNAEIAGVTLRDIDEKDRTFTISDISGGAKGLMLVHELDEPIFSLYRKEEYKNQRDYINEALEGLVGCL